MGARRKARELALQMLFQHDMSGNQPDQIIDTFEELQKSKPNTREFAEKIFRGTIVHLPELDEMIQNRPRTGASPGWPPWTATSSACRSTNSCTRTTRRSS